MMPDLSVVSRVESSVLVERRVRGEAFPRVPVGDVELSLGPFGDVCADCAGGLWTEDSDGSLSGVVGTVVPCECVLGDDTLAGTPGCGCVSGWVKTAREEWAADPECPALRLCVVHPAAAGVLGVAA